MLPSEIVHGPKAEPAAAVIVPVSFALYASSVPDGKCSFLPDRYATSSPSCQKEMRFGVTVSSSFFVRSTILPPPSVTVVSILPTPTPYTGVTSL